MRVNSLFFCFFAFFATMNAQTNVIGAKEARISEAQADDESMFIVANQKYLLGDYTAAQEMAEKIVYAQEKNDGAYFLLARIHLAAKNFNDALIAIKKAGVIDPENKWYYHLQAEIFEATARHKDAIDVYETLLKKNPTAPLYFEKLSYLHILGGEPEQSLVILDRWQKAVGINEDIADKRHLIQIGLKNDKGAIEAYEDLARAYPTKTEGLHKLAKYYRETTRQAEAAATYQRILNINPEDPEARIGALAKTETVGVAGSDFLSALRPLLADPTIQIDSKVSKLMPFLKKMEQETDSTKRALMKGAAKDLTITHPNEAKSWSFAGDVHYLMNENNEALTLYKKCISLQPNVFSVWQNTFEILNQKEDYKELLSISEKGMDAFPNQPVSYYYYGVAANALNKPSDAFPQLQQAFLMAGNQLGLKLDVTAQLGLAHIKSGKPDKAIEVMEPSLPKGGNKHPFVLEFLGDAHMAKGDKTKALEFWKAAQQIQSSARLMNKLK